MTTRDIEYHLPRPKFMGPAQWVIWHHAEERLKDLGAIPRAITVTTYDEDYNVMSKVLSWTNPYLSYGSTWMETCTHFPEEIEDVNWMRSREAVARQFHGRTCEELSDPHPDITIRPLWRLTTTKDLVDAVAPATYGLGNYRTPALSSVFI